MPRLSAAAARRAAGMLAEAIGEGRALPPLPKDCRPGTAAAGRRIAAHVLEALGLVPVGLRLAPALGADDAAAGPILESRLLRGPVALPPAPMPTGRRATLALLAQLAAELPARPRPYRAAEVLRRIGSLHVALDLAETRFAAGPADLASHLADLSGLGLVVFGAPARAGWREAVRAPLAARVGDGTAASWRGTVDVAGALLRAAEAARLAGGLPKGALLLAAGVSPALPDGALVARVARIGAAERLGAPP